ncbi:MAG TPA: NAD(P)H-dependent oxidoreductase [Candidatus Paceibacterota bacterium]|nr:NAD(P)H-dependent oxidoreductase [Candidatus Paceibacterota bacterium]
MRKKRIFILLGHPDKDTLSGELATTYEEAARAAGHEVERLNIGELSFDPILHKGYKVIQELEPDLKLVQEKIRWCDHFVLVYPLWWSATPALLKGMFDRMWLPAFAFRFNKGKPGWQKLLKGKSARVITLMKSHAWEIRLMFGDFTNEISRATLGFAGFKVRLTEVGGAEELSVANKAALLEKVSELGRRAF